MIMTALPHDLSELPPLLALYDRLEAQAKEAAEKFEAVKKAIKNAAYEIHVAGRVGRRVPTKVVLNSPYLAKPLVMDYRQTKKLDTQKIKDNHSQAWVDEFSTVTGAWYLGRQK